MRPALPAVAALLVLAGSVSLRAHHSHPAFYDACKTLTIEGVIESVEWKNPHVLIDLRADDGKAYRAEWTSAGALGRRAVEPPKAGDRVVMAGNPMRDAAAIQARFPTLKLAPRDKPVVDLVQIRRASDGWTWTRPGPAAPPDCGGK